MGTVASGLPASVAPMAHLDVVVGGLLAAVGAGLAGALDRARRSGRPRVGAGTVGPSTVGAGTVGAGTVGAGTVLAAVAGAVLVVSGNAPRSLLVTLAVLAAGGAAAARVLAAGGEGGRWRLAAAAPIVPGAVLVAWGPAAVPGPAWVHWMAAAATVAMAGGLGSFDQRWTAMVLPLLAVAAAGVYATVPDTEQAAIVLAAAVGVALAGGPLRLPLGRWGAPAVAGLMVWTVAVDGRGRQASVVGGLGCLAVLAVAPAAAALAGARRRARGPVLASARGTDRGAARRRRRRNPSPAWMALVIEVVVLVPIGRQAGREALPVAVLAMMSGLALACVLLFAALHAADFATAASGPAATSEGQPAVPRLPAAGAVDQGGHGVVGPHRQDVAAVPEVLVPGVVVHSLDVAGEDAPEYEPGGAKDV